MSREIPGWPFQEADRERMSISFLKPEASFPKPEA
jgi:hypothetical protein